MDIVFLDLSLPIFNIYILRSLSYRFLFKVAQAQSNLMEKYKFGYRFSIHLSRHSNFNKVIVDEVPLKSFEDFSTIHLPINSELVPCPRWEKAPQSRDAVTCIFYGGDGIFSAMCNVRSHPTYCVLYRILIFHFFLSWPEQHIHTYIVSPTQLVANCKRGFLLLSFNNGFILTLFHKNMLVECTTNSCAMERFSNLSGGT